MEVLYKTIMEIIGIMQQAISVNYKFERRIGMYPAGFEENGQMYVNTGLWGLSTLFT